MRPTKPLVAMLLFLILSCVGYAADLGGLYLRIVEGDVQVRTEETEGWVAAAINTPLKERDRLWVPENGRAEIILHDGTAVRLGRNTSFEVMTTDQGAYRFFLEEGRLYTNRGESAKRALFVETPSTSVRAYGKARFKVDVSTAGDTDVAVHRGDVRVERPSGEMQLNAGERLVQRRDAPSVEMGRVGPADQWDLWNSRLDKDWERPVDPGAAAALPEELRPYSRDLASNGRWVTTEDYGYVWVPTVAVVADWAPYRIGTWVWLGGTYVWLSYEPWGWLPYHYGRWAHVVSLGWCWVPPTRRNVYWGPGYVGWVCTPRHVAWVPLAPREIYYGPGYYGPYSARIPAWGGVVKQQYRHVSLSNGVTVVSRDSFRSGKPVMVSTRENPFFHEGRTIGPPALRPETTGFGPRVKPIPAAYTPPARIQGREARMPAIETKAPAPPATSPQRLTERRERPPERLTNRVLPEREPKRGPENVSNRPAQASTLSPYRPQGFSGTTPRVQRTEAPRTPVVSPMPSPSGSTARLTVSPPRTTTLKSVTRENSPRISSPPPARESSRPLSTYARDEVPVDRRESDGVRSERGEAMGGSRVVERPPAVGPGTAGFSPGGSGGGRGFSTGSGRGTVLPSFLGGGRPQSGPRAR